MSRLSSLMSRVCRLTVKAVESVDLTYTLTLMSRYVKVCRVCREYVENMSRYVETWLSQKIRTSHLSGYQIYIESVGTPSPILLKLGVTPQKIDFLPFDSYATRRIPLSKLALTKRLHHRQIPYRSPDDVYQTWLLKARTARGAHRRNESRARSQHVVDATPRASCARG